mmetsp:Transcript_50154/g.54146  ORF Transcript_50154/g.54146 Transcript_50154/m.54146 type:complete len:83 (+) Transcript_50154:141-389(+)
MIVLAACAADLQKEALALAALQQQSQQHTNDVTSMNNETSHSNNNNTIVQVMGWTPSGVASYAKGYHASFFFVMEKTRSYLQ